MVVPWEIGLDKSTAMNKEVMWNNMKIFKESMDKHDIPFIIMFGGLLGLIRDGKLIDTDDDIDLACFSEDHRKIGLVVEDLKSKGFYIPEKNECPLHDHFFIKDGEKIEIWWFDKLGEERVYDNIVRYDARYFEETETFNHKGVDWLIPSNPKKFLELTYGRTWTRPQKNGSYAQGLG
jgi:lipopolysaccharide cholinephosphotransferase